MINDALLKLLENPVEDEVIERNSLKEIDKFATEFNEYINTVGIDKIAKMKIPNVSVPAMAALLSAGAGITALIDYISQKRGEGKANKNRSMVLSHIKTLYPKKEHGHVEEAFASLSHVAPSVAQDPLIARTIIKNMMQQMTRADLQTKGFGQVGLDTISSAGKIEESKAKSDRDARKTVPFFDTLHTKLKGTREELGMYKEMVPPSPKSTKPVEHIHSWK